MRYIRLIVFFLFFSILFPLQAAFAQTDGTVEQTFYKGTVEKIVRDGTQTVSGKKNPYQQLRIRVNDGPDQGKTFTIEHGGMFTITADQKVRHGETVILSRTSSAEGTTSYGIVDTYRLPWVLGIIAGFFLLIFIIAGKKGIGAIAGMLISLAVIMRFIIPQILSGTDPILISVIGSIFILVVTMYLAHGFSPQTHIAVTATAISLSLTALFAIFFVSLAKLSGLGSEDIYSLQQGYNGVIQFRGLLLGGIIIGALGVLDDVTTTQAATVEELHKTNPKHTMQELFRKGMRVGQTHIASVVNTLVLAYAGASIGVFIFLHLGMQENIQPLWVMANSEVIMEEVIRTIAGSLGLILAVPITTLLAAFFAKNTIKIQ